MFFVLDIDMASGPLPQPLSEGEGSSFTHMEIRNLYKGRDKQAVSLLKDLTPGPYAKEEGVASLIWKFVIYIKVETSKE